MWSRAVDRVSVGSALSESPTFLIEDIVTHSTTSQIAWAPPRDVTPISEKCHEVLCHELAGDGAVVGTGSSAEKSAETRERAPYKWNVLTPTLWGHDLNLSEWHLLCCLVGRCEFQK